MIIFDGNNYAREMEAKIVRSVEELNQQSLGVKIGVLAATDTTT